MANDPENPKPRFSRTIIVATAVATVIAVIVFAKSLPRRSPVARPDLPTTTTTTTTTTQSVAQLSAQEAEAQPNQAVRTTPPTKEIRPRDESGSSQGPDELRALSVLQQQLDQVKQAQEQQIQTIASQLELITRHQEASLQAASRMAAQILDLSQKAAAVSTQHQESVRAIAAIEAKIGNSPEALSIPTRTGGNNNNNSVGTTTASKLADLRLPGVSTSTLSNNNGLQLNFASAIFDRDDHFRIGSKPRLHAVAKALVQSREDVVVYVVGLASAEPNTWPWLEPRATSEMALLRACRVATYLESLGIFPPAAILPRAGSADDFPFPAGDINNRTVLLRIFPAAYAQYSDRK